MTLKINILTVFPEMFDSVLNASILGRAIESGLLEINVVNIRDYSANKHLKTDDYPFGGGAGMVMMPQPVFDAIAAHTACKARMLYMSPRGDVLDQNMIEEFSKQEEITVLCGHYEGMDQRVLDHFGFEEVSIGDYILTGGELPAMVLIDSIARFIPDVLGNSSANEEESIYSGLLEYAQYTRPGVFEYDGEAYEVPEVLMGGNHKEIRLWNFRSALAITLRRRPDMLRRFIDAQERGGKYARELIKEEKKLLEEYKALLEEKRKR